MTKQTLVDALINQICDRYPPTHRVALSFRDCAFAVYTNSEAVIELTHTEYGHLVTPVAKVARLLTIIDTPPLSLDYDVLTIEGSKRIAVGACNLDLIDGDMEHAPRPGILYLISHDRDVMVGPCLANPSDLLGFIYHRYQAVLAADGGRRRSRPVCGTSIGR